MSDYTAITSDDAELKDLWIDTHFFNTPEISVAILNGDEEIVPSNPDPTHHSTIVVSTAHETNLEHLPEPTWLIVHGGEVFYCYRLMRPASTEQVERIIKDTGEVKMGRGASYNKTLKLEYNLARIVDGRNPESVPNLEAVLDDDDTEARWNGKTFTLPELETLTRDALKGLGMRWESLTPKHLKEGGEALTDAQYRQRRAASAKARAANSDQALTRDREILKLHEDGMTTEKLAAHLGIAEGSVANRLMRARKRLREAEAEEALEPVEVTPEPVEVTPEPVEVTPEPALHCSNSSPEPEPLEVVPEPVKVHTEAPEPVEPTAELEPVEVTPEPAVDHTEALNALLASFKGSSGGPLGRRKDPVSAWS